MSLIRRILRNHTAHKKLGEETSLAISEADVSLCGDTTERRFDLKLVGTAPAERAASAPATANAVAKAVALAKASRKKLRKVTLTVSPKGITITDAGNSENIMDLSIFRISYCSADAAHGGIFAVVVGGAEEGLACHTFLADKRKTARAVALAAAQAFNAAYQAWQSNQDKMMYHRPTRSQPWAEEPKRTQETEATNPLIDFRNSSNLDSSNMSPWVSFDDDEDEMNETAWDMPPNSMPLVTFSIS